MDCASTFIPPTNQHHAVAVADLLAIKKRSYLETSAIIRLTDGTALPIGTPLVCERGGKTVLLLYKHPTRHTLERIRIANYRLSEIAVLKFPRDLPIELCLAVGLDLESAEMPTIKPGIAYYFVRDINIATGTALSAGDIVICKHVLGALYRFEALKNGDSFFIPPRDTVLLKSVDVTSHNGGVRWIH